MKCLLCENKGKVRPTINGSLTICNEHFGLLERLQKQYEKRNEVRARVKKTQEYHKERFIKKRARYATNLMIKAGGIMKRPCEVCGKEKVDVHHDDYSDPERVRFLCRKHHAEHHKNHKIKI
jgi:hypothetical protein